MYVYTCMCSEELVTVIFPWLAHVFDSLLKLNSSPPPATDTFFLQKKRKVGSAQSARKSREDAKHFLKAGVGCDFLHPWKSSLEQLV